MQSPSGLFKAGEVLLLVGAIVSAASALLMVGLAIGFSALVAAFDDPDAPTWVAWLYGILALIMVASTAFGFVGYGKARKGDPQGGFVFGLVASLLPPVQVIPLLGAILCRASPEGEAAAHRRIHGAP